MAADAPGRTSLAPTRELLLFIGLAALCAAPLLGARYLPFLDLPQHLGLATIIHHLHDPGWGFEAFYEIDWRPLPYWGFYGPVHLLAFFMPVTTAARLVLFLAALGLPLGARALFRAFGRDGSLGLCAIPLIWNTNLYMGFVAFVVAVPLFLFAVAAAERLLSAPGFCRRDAAYAGLLGVAVYLGHGQVFLLYLCALAVLLVSHASTRGWRLLLRGLAFGPAFALGLAWTVWVLLARVDTVGAPEHLKVLGALGVIGKVSWEPLMKSFVEMPRRLYDVSPGLRDDLPFVLLFVGLAVGILWRGIRLGRSFAPSPGVVEIPPPRRGAALMRWLHARRLELLAGGLLLSYFVSPMEIGMQWYVNPRHLLLAALLLPALLPRGIFASGKLWGRLLPGFVAALSLAVAAQASSTARTFSREAEGFEVIVSAASSGGRTLGLIFDNGGGGAVRLWPFLHFAAYLQAAKGGDLGFSFAGLPSLPVRYRPGAQAPHPYEWRPETFRLDRYGAYYDRYLIRGRPRGDALRLSEGASKVLRSGAWTLIERARKNVPIRGKSGNFSVRGASIGP